MSTESSLPASNSSEVMVINIDESVVKKNKKRATRTPRATKQKINTKTLKNKFLDKISTQLNAEHEIVGQTDMPNQKEKEKEQGKKIGLLSSECSESLAYLQSLNQDSLKKTIKKKESTGGTITFNAKNTIQEYTPANTIQTDKIQTDTTKLSVPYDQPTYSHVQSHKSHEPPYGVLKNGKKQTYRQWKRKMQGGNKLSATIRNPNAQKLVIPSVQQMKPKKLKKTIKTTKRTSYTSGKYKDATTHKVGVFLKNDKLQNEVKHAHNSIALIPMHDIKKYLLKHNIIKIDSNAPETVMRKMYESALLSGEIVNSNTNNMIYNFKGGA